jgi:hypothetical protein
MNIFIVFFAFSILKEAFKKGAASKGSPLEITPKKPNENALYIEKINFLIFLYLSLS